MYNACTQSTDLQPYIVIPMEAEMFIARIVLKVQHHSYLASLLKCEFLSDFPVEAGIFNICEMGKRLLDAIDDGPAHDVLQQNLKLR